jgi:hypothetical protein
METRDLIKKEQAENEVRFYGEFSEWTGYFKEDKKVAEAWFFFLKLLTQQREKHKEEQRETVEKTKWETLALLGFRGLINMEHVEELDKFKDEYLTTKGRDTENQDPLEFQHIFTYELLSDEEIRKHIRECEGHHVQQVSFSTFMDCITQNLRNINS